MITRNLCVSIQCPSKLASIREQTCYSSVSVPTIIKKSVFCFLSFLLRKNKRFLFNSLMFFIISFSCWIVFWRLRPIDCGFWTKASCYYCTMISIKMQSKKPFLTSISSMSNREFISLARYCYKSHWRKVIWIFNGLLSFRLWFLIISPIMTFTFKYCCLIFLLCCVQ